MPVRSFERGMSVPLFENVFRKFRVLGYALSEKAAHMGKSGSFLGEEAGGSHENPENGIRENVCDAILRKCRTALVRCCLYSTQKGMRNNGKCNGHGSNGENREGSS